MPSFNDAYVAPPSFGPQIATLGNLINAFSARDMQLEEQRRADEEASSKERKEAAKESYYRKKQELQEGKQESDRQFAIAKENREAFEAAMRSVKAGEMVQPYPVRQADGSVKWVHPRLVNDEAASPAPSPSVAPAPAPAPAQVPATQAPPPQGAAPQVQQGGIPTMGGKPLMAPPTLSALVDAQAQSREAQVSPPKSDPEFVQRMRDPNAPVLRNPDGSYSTHLMASATVDGKEIAYPTIVNIGGRLKHLSDDEAYNYALRTGEYKVFPTRQEAEAFGQGSWKQGSAAIQAQEQKYGGVPTVMLDEPEEDSAQAVIEGQGEPQTVQLPRRAFPQGATEGERFPATDVNMTGGYGNPFARDVMLDEPEGDTANAVIETGAGTKDVQLPMSSFPPGAQEGQRFPAEQLGQPTQGGAAGAVPTMGGKPIAAPMVAAAEMGGGAAPAAAQAKRGPYWLMESPDGQEVRIYMEDLRAAKRAENAQKVQELSTTIEQLSHSPDPKDAQVALMLARERAMLMSGMDPSTRSAMLAAMNKSDLTSQTEAGKTQRQATGIASKEKIAEERNQTALTIAQMRKKRAASGGTLVMGKAGEPGSAFEAFANRDPLKAERVANYIDTQMSRTLQQTNFTKLIGIGENRLDLAMRQVSQTGPFAATSQVEAMMNFFGYIRGGVPAKNETQEWEKLTGTFSVWADKLGQTLQIGPIGTEYLNGDLTEGQIKQLLANKTGGNLSPQLVAGLKQAIGESQRALHQYSQKACDTLAAQFANRSKMEKELVQGKLDGIATYSHLPKKDYFGLHQQSEEASSGAPAQGRSLSDKLSHLEEILK